MVRHAHHDRKKTVRPELVEGCPYRPLRLAVRPEVLEGWTAAQDRIRLRSSAQEVYVTVGHAAQALALRALNETGFVTVTFTQNRGPFLWFVPAHRSAVFRHAGVGALRACGINLKIKSYGYGKGMVRQAHQDREKKRSS